MFTEGSVFKKPVRGKILDITPDGFEKRMGIGFTDMVKLSYSRSKGAIMYEQKFNIFKANDN